MIKKYLSYKKSLKVQNNGVITGIIILIVGLPTLMWAIVIVKSTAFHIVGVITLITFILYMMIKVNNHPKFP